MLVFIPEPDEEIPFFEAFSSKRLCTQSQQQLLANSQPSATSSAAPVGVQNHGSRSSLNSTQLPWPKPFHRYPVGGMQPIGHDARSILSDVVRTKQLYTFCMTWNMHGKPWPADLEHHLPIGKFHIYAIGTQEAEAGISASIVMPGKTKWETALKHAFGDRYTHVYRFGCCFAHTVCSFVLQFRIGSDSFEHFHPLSSAADCFRFAIIGCSNWCGKHNWEQRRCWNRLQHRKNVVCIHQRPFSR